MNDNNEISSQEIQDKELVKQWLLKNEVTVCESGAVTENIEYTFGSKKKKK
jgi:hypothetical protein